MKGMAPIIGLVVVALVVLAAASYGGILKPATLVDGKIFVMPQFGFIKCEQIADYTRSVSDSFTGDVRTQGHYVEFGDTENAPSGDWYVYCADKSYFAFQYDGDTGAFASCPTASTNWCKVPVIPGQVKKIASDVKVGEIMRIGGCYDDWILTNTWGSGQFQEGWNPFGLVVYDSGQRVLYNTKSCKIDATFSDYADVCKDANCGKVPKSAAFLPYYESMNYLASFVYAPIDDNNKIVTYNGQQAYCQVNSVYSLESFKTNGATYIRPKSLIGTVACCPGMRSAGVVCGADFTWQDTSSPDTPQECFTALQCEGQGTWQPDYGTPANDIVQFDCVSGKCKEIGRKTVACTPPATGCQPGFVCSPEKGYICIQQEGPGVRCGDGVCSRPYEDATNCNVDCEGFDFVSFVSVFLAAFFVGALVMIIIIGILAWYPITRVFVMKGGRKAIITAIIVGGLGLALIFTVPLLAAVGSV